MEPSEREIRITQLEERKRVCWEMAGVFLTNRDFHGIYDMGVEIAALERAITELRELYRNVD